MRSGTARLAIDVGGTFTDVVLLDEATGALRFGKVLSTPEDKSIGSLEGARGALQDAGLAPGAVRDVVHATTVATNTVPEREGAVTGLVTTQGFRDVLAARREARCDIHDLNITAPQPLVPRARRLDVAERLDHRGAVLTPPDEASGAAAADSLREVEAAAMCLPHSHVYAAHERRVADLLRARLPAGVELSVSSEVAGEARECERSSTVVVDACAKPMMRRDADRPAAGPEQAGIGRQRALMLSHGGIGEARQVASAHPVRRSGSGPAAGADAVAFDMGGTAAKMSLVRGGTPTVTDADLLLGYLDPAFFLGGAMTLEVAGAEAAMARLGGRIGLDAAETAFGIHDIVKEHMAAAIRAHAAEQGVDLPDGVPIGPKAMPALTAAFAETDAGVYGHAPPKVPLEVVNLRARVEQVKAQPDLRQPAARGGDPVKGLRALRFDRGAAVQATVYDRYALAEGAHHAGPAIVKERETCVVIGPGARFARDAAGHLVITMEPGA